MKTLREEVAEVNLAVADAQDVLADSLRRSAAMRRTRSWAILALMKPCAPDDPGHQIA